MESNSVYSVKFGGTGVERRLGEVVNDIDTVLAESAAAQSEADSGGLGDDFDVMGRHAAAYPDTPTNLDFGNGL